MLRMTPTAISDDVVAVTVPAEGGWLGVLRTATAGLAARLSLSGEKIEDLRIAVDEACAMLLVLTPPNGELQCRFEIGAEELTIAVSAPVVPGAQLPSPTSFAWQVLTGLTSRVEAEQGETHMTIRIMRSYEPLN
jgi:serine/threonine-protein kinase RsbW